MSRALNKLTAKAVAALKEPGRYSDGGGLYAVISPAGSGKWVFRFTYQGSNTDMGLGAFRDISLKDARDRAQDARSKLARGISPLTSRREEAMARRAKPTFGEMASSVVASLSEGFRNEKHRAQWSATLGLTPTDDSRVRIGAGPQGEHAKALAAMSAKPVDQVVTADIMAVLRPIWRLKPETAKRLRGRIERVLDAARAEGHIPADRANPARWRGHLDTLLSKPDTLTRGHHAALDYRLGAAFFSALLQNRSMSGLALQFAILTAARSGEVLKADWSEIDMETCVWTIPKQRMKAGREHRVPLNQRAMEILRHLAQGPRKGYVFKGARDDRPLSLMSMTMVLRRMKRSDITVHGFRSCFRDWAADCTSHPNHVCEAALAHTVSDKVEAAYRRSDLFEKRRELMADWNAFLMAQPDAVVTPSELAA
ncbi:tyrosine-type recombinase/integrase [Phreatobacter sp.]|uniref:tyrosine-type recombinase/integrase n=1 Tax=Phreatobacter sp. TaxID=1966341 RepID=UPI003F717D5F